MRNKSYPQSSILKILSKVGLLLFVGVMFYACADTEPDVKAEDSQALELRDPSQPTLGSSCVFRKVFGNCRPGTEVRNISFPEYPGCTFNISINTVLCSSIEDPNVYESILIGNFTVNEHNCEAYEEDLANAMANGSLVQFSEDFNHMVWRKFEALFLTDIGPNSTTVFTVEGTVESCVNTCYISDPQSGFTTPIDINCGTDCCIVRRTYERQPSGELVFTGSTIETNDCNDPSTLPICPLGSVSSTGCRINCFPMD